MSYGAQVPFVPFQIFERILGLCLLTIINMDFLLDVLIVFVIFVLVWIVPLVGGLSAVYITSANSPMTVALVLGLTVISLFIGCLRLAGILLSGMSKDKETPSEN